MKSFQYLKTKIVSGENSLNSSKYHNDWIGMFFEYTKTKWIVFKADLKTMYIILKCLKTLLFKTNSTYTLIIIVLV